MDIEKMLSLVEDRLLRCHILVVGDVMLDKYYYGEVTRISPEAPVPINHITRQKETLGGAANVSHNLARLGCNTLLAGFVGEDYHFASLKELLIKNKIDHTGLIPTNRPTTTKMRIIGAHQQMMRLDFESSEPLEKIYTDQLLSFVRGKLSESIDAIIVSDYAKGACTEYAMQAIIEAAHAHGVLIIIDPKGAHWTKYQGGDYITPNIKEINDVLPYCIKNTDAEVIKAAHYIMQKYKIKNVLVTRSESGVSLIRDGKEEHIPTHAEEVFDVSGAGDTVIAVLAAGLAGGLKDSDAAFLANLAASVVVRKLGTYAVSHEELKAALKNLPSKKVYKKGEVL